MPEKEHVPRFTANKVAEQMVGEQPAELSVEEQNLLSVAHKNALRGRRAVWRVTTSVEHEGETKANEQHTASAWGARRQTGR